MRSIILLLLNSLAATLSVEPETVNIALETSLILDGKRLKSQLKKYEGILRQLGLSELLRNSDSKESEMTFGKFSSELNEIIKTYSTEKTNKFVKGFMMELFQYLADDEQIYEFLFDPKFKDSVSSFFNNASLGNTEELKDTLNGFVNSKHVQEQMDEHFKKEGTRLKVILEKFKKFGEGDYIDIRETIRDYINFLAEIDKKIKPQYNFRSHLVRQVQRIGTDSLNESKQRYKSKLSKGRYNEWRRNMENKPIIVSPAATANDTDIYNRDDEDTKDENVIVINKDLEIAVRGENL